MNQFIYYNVLWLTLGMNESNINWNDVIKKEERGLDNADLGEVQGLEQGLIVTKRGLVDKHIFYFPQILVDRFDGQTLFLKVTDVDAAKYEGR
jgi:hypothetical protein